MGSLVRDFEERLKKVLKRICTRLSSSLGSRRDHTLVRVLPAGPI